MTREDLKTMIMLAMVFGLFDHELGAFLLKACEEEAKEDGSPSQSGLLEEAARRSHKAAQSRQPRRGTMLADIRDYFMYLALDALADGGLSRTLIIDAFHILMT